MISLTGLKIVDYRPATPDELGALGWEDLDRGQQPRVIILSNGMKLIASSDEEGNRAGALFIVDADDLLVAIDGTPMETPPDMYAFGQACCPRKFLKDNDQFWQWSMRNYRRDWRDRLTRRQVERLGQLMHETPVEAETTSDLISEQ